MALAAVFAVSSAAGTAWLDVPTMARLHGTANALGFALPGLLAWALDPPASRATVPGSPFGLVRARWRSP
jgi:hypothetical protein